MVLVLLMLVIVVLMHVFGVFALHLHRLDPAGALHDLAHIEAACAENILHVDLAVVGFNDFCLGLQRLDDLQNGFLFLGRHQIHLVENDGGAVFDLLNEQVFNILLVQIVVEQRLAGAEFVRHALGVHDGGDAVEICHGRQVRLLLGAVEHTDGACDRTRLANAGRLDQDIVKALGARQLDDLLHQIDLERAADAAVLQRNEVVVLLCHRAALGDQRRVDIDLADVVDDDRYLVALLVGENMVENSGFACAQITREQGNGNELLLLFLEHIDPPILLSSSIITQKGEKCKR